MEGEDRKYTEEVYSDRVKAGKRTYFFDIRSTKNGDYYITITESKRQQKGLGFYYEKHKVFLYKEDFQKFSEGLTQVVDKAKEFIQQETGSYPTDRVNTDRVNTASDTPIA